MPHFLRNNPLRFALAITILFLTQACKLDSVSIPTAGDGSKSVALTNDSAKHPHDRAGTNTAARFAKAYGKLPISFEVNQGQTDKSVRFLARVAGYTLFLTTDEAVLALHQKHAGTVKTRTSATHATRIQPSPVALLTPVAETSSTTVRLRLLGANRTADVTGLERLPGKSNYFLSNDPAKWRSDIPTYAKVRYGNIYPGVDLVYYGNQ